MDLKIFYAARFFFASATTGYNYTTVTSYSNGATLIKLLSTD